ncbi:hypothetical protein [Herbidospora mongoliensis]|uniref:hypothetical protein n=1 Tax=Herbidospora mongoliensis TaxID=688067 RepID=UPI000AF7063B|nr:hypothetical protein [Herbidospora mongoliensis]
MVSTRTAQVRPAGLLLTFGATAWAIGTLIVGDKIYEGIQTLDTVTGMLFVVGVFAWIVLVAQQRLAGDGVTRFLPYVLMATLTGAFVLNALSFGYKSHDDFPLWLAAIDACWPLSQLLLLVLGVVMAVQGRLQGVLCWLPLLAGAWFPVTMAASILGGDTFSTIVSAAWLIGTFGVLGALVAAQPHRLVSVGQFTADRRPSASR